MKISLALFDPKCYKKYLISNSLKRIIRIRKHEKYAYKKNHSKVACFFLYLYFSDTLFIVLIEKYDAN